MLKQTKYTIKTGNCNNTEYSTQDARLFGTSQGAGWSPPYWAANSDVISYVMERFTPGMLLEHPTRERVSHRHIDTFVDDSSLGTTSTAYEQFHPPPGAPVPKADTLYAQARLKYSILQPSSVHHRRSALYLGQWHQKIATSERYLPPDAHPTRH